MTRSSKRHTILPIDLGMTSKAITDSVWSATSSFGAGGYRSMAVEVMFTYSAASDIQFYLQHSPDGTNWATEQAVSTAGGIANMTDHIYFKSTGGASGNWYVPVELRMEQGYYRLQFTGTAGDGSDTITVYVHMEA